MIIFASSLPMSSPYYPVIFSLRLLRFHLSVYRFYQCTRDRSNRFHPLQWTSLHCLLGRFQMFLEYLKFWFLLYFVELQCLVVLHLVFICPVRFSQSSFGFLSSIFYLLSLEILYSCLVCGSRGKVRLSMIKIGILLVLPVRICLCFVGIRSTMKLEGCSMLWLPTVWTRWACLTIIFFHKSPIFCILHTLLWCKLLIFLKLNDLLASRSYVHLIWSFGIIRLVGVFYVSVVHLFVVLGVYSPYCRRFYLPGGF